MMTTDLKEYEQPPSCYVDQQANGAHAFCLKTNKRIAYHQLHIECERLARFRGYFVTNPRW